MTSSSFRITLDHLKQDLVGLEKFQDNSYYQDFLADRIKQAQSGSLDNNTSTSSPINTNTPSSPISTSTPPQPFTTSQSVPPPQPSTLNKNKSYDIFDLILLNVNVNEIDEDYVYIREIDNDLYLKDINSTSPILDNIDINENNNNVNNVNNDNNNNNNNNNNNDNKEDTSQDTSSDTNSSSGNGSNSGSNSPMIDLNLKNDDNTGKKNKNNNNNNDSEDDKILNENNNMKKEIKENKRNMIKKIKELKANDDTFNEAFKFIDINKWLKTKGSDIISDQGSLEYDIKECMNKLESKINELNNLVSISNIIKDNDINNNNNNNNKSILSTKTFIEKDNNNNNEDDNDVM